MTYEEMARIEGWIVTLDHNDQFVAHDDLVDDEDPAYYLDAEEEEDAWKELCELEGITEEGIGRAYKQQADGSWIEV